MSGEVFYVGLSNIETVSSFVYTTKIDIRFVNSYEWAEKISQVLTILHILCYTCHARMFLLVDLFCGDSNITCVIFYTSGLFLIL